MNTPTTTPPDNLPATDILTIPEVYRYLRISRTHGYDLVRRGVIPSFSIGKNVRVRRKDLLKYVEGQMR